MTAVLRKACRARWNTAGRYTLCEMTGLFLAFSVAGWLFEVGLHLLLDGELVNRGTLLGPWLPIYGAGGLLSVLLLTRFAARPPVVFALGALLSTAIEFATGKYLLSVYGLRWWDYSMFPLNIDGLVSPPSTLVFGFGCCAAVYLASPLLLRGFRCVPRSTLRLLCAGLAVLFVLDFGVSALHPNTGRGVASPTTAQDGMQVIEPAQIELLLHNLPK